MSAPPPFVDRVLDGDAHVGRSQGRRVVDAVAHATDHVAPGVQGPDDPFLHGINVLIFVDNYVQDPPGQPRSHSLVVFKDVRGLCHDGGVIEIPFLM